MKTTELELNFYTGNRTIRRQVAAQERAVVPPLFRWRTLVWLWLVALVLAGSGLVLWAVAWWR